MCCFIRVLDVFLAIPVARSPTADASEDLRGHDVDVSAESLPR